MSKPDLIQTLRDMENDPMWPGHVEMHKNTLRAVIAALSEQRAEPAPQPSPGSGWSDAQIAAVLHEAHVEAFWSVNKTGAEKRAFYDGAKWALGKLPAALAAKPVSDAQRTPLSKEKIDFILRDAFLAANGSVYNTRIYDFVTAIEEEHGISGERPVSDAQDGREAEPAVKPNLSAEQIAKMAASEDERALFEDYAARTYCNRADLEGRGRMTGYRNPELNQLWTGWVMSVKAHAALAAAPQAPAGHKVGDRVQVTKAVGQRDAGWTGTVTVVNANFIEIDREWTFDHKDVLAAAPQAAPGQPVAWVSSLPDAMAAACKAALAETPDSERHAAGKFYARLWPKVAAAVATPQAAPGSVPEDAKR